MGGYLSSSLTDDKLNCAEAAEVFVFPTSFAQQRLWFLDRLAPGNPFYNVSTALRLEGAIDFTALEQTFNEIVRRHETLRTTFVVVDGQPLQAISPSLSIQLPLIDLRNFESQARELQLRQIATAEARQPFDLTTGPLLRVKLLQLDDVEYVLLLNFHHIVADGWSIGVLIRELGILYKAFASGDRHHKAFALLPELPIQYADFAQWQREWLQELDVNGCSPLQTQLAYWQHQLDDIPVLNLPTDRPRPAVPSYKGAKQVLELSPSLSQALEALSYREGVTLFVTMLTAFETLLYRYTQQENIAIGSPIANRNRSELEGIIGFFVNSLVLRTDCSGQPTFRELLHRVREVTLGAYAHQDLPFEKLVEELHPERDLSYHPLFQVAFSFQNTPISTLELPGVTVSLLDLDATTTSQRLEVVASDAKSAYADYEDWDLECVNSPGDCHTTTAKLDLEFHLWQDLGSIKGQMVYSTDIFDDVTITQMLGHFQTLLASIIANPEQRISAVAILSAIERQQLLIDWNDTKKEYPNECFHQLFEERVRETPDAIALVFNQQQLTYRDLNIYANQLAHCLQELGIVPDRLVGICLDRSPETIVAILGILKAGGAYLPLDPSLPQERLNLMLADAGVSVLITRSHSIARFENFLQPIIDLDRDSASIRQYSPENLTNCVTLDNLAYVIYTSGSTGQPKGVAIEHRGLSNLAQVQIEVFNIQPSHRILQFASLSFDASIFEIVMALQSGATLDLATKESLLPGRPLLELLRDRAITHVTLPPAVLAVLPLASLPALQTIICAGEPCPADMINRWWQPQRQFFNAYGLTEATVWSTIAEIKSTSAQISIGRPISNTQIYILDKHLEPVPIGIDGELYIGGDGLGRGYINRPELTAKHFIANPFDDRQAARLYKTGDLARYRSRSVLCGESDGNIEFLGRSDDLVKVRGFRIELSEIETAIRRYPQVQTVVVIDRDNSYGDKYLIAYIVPNIETPNFIFSLRKLLTEKLPEYMMPKAFVILDTLPLTASGKIDRDALVKIAPAQEIDREFIAPRTPTESTLAQIWAEVLNIDRVGIYDNFFDLGGDSLLTVRLLQQISEQLNYELPLASLFLNPTIESLATCLSSSPDNLARSPLVAIQPDGSSPAFFCVHPIFGVIFPYYELAAQLGKDRPFYALQPIGLDGKTPPLTRIEDMAAHYIEALRSVQPHGPYYLGGWSFGGWVAFEMAQQLQQAGQEVALLAVLDTLAPIPGHVSLGHGLKFMLTTAARYIWPFFLDYVYLIIAIVKQQIQSLRDRFPILNKILRYSGWEWLMQSRSRSAPPRRSQQNTTVNPSKESQLRILSELAIVPMLRVFYANSQAALDYVPQAYSSRINLFRTKDRSSLSKEDPSLSWDRLAQGGTEIHHLPGNHLTMLRKPHIQVLAAQLKACIDKAALRG
ncbi:non-ribosomal peptide synthetase [Chamaesiphon minutus]|uniref:Amino acid adenylation enzyme/thioester reductase family protein n=1 Tax=Chamaesiphon minutus (strain ATCC 27169 / PCC 6605) TaxID=1173020 RepID=K9UAI5_CHAP6|nr:non-ribosomal peptide synthetase [Chamaesiphon minutus]AFY92127.1 amino acid adenylation enzyme/thioester reductase family protein [Chamaesiphon minutus PCC 6605]